MQKRRITTKELPQNTRTEKDSSKSSGMRIGSMLYHRGYLRMSRKGNGLLLGRGKELKTLLGLVVSQLRDVTAYVNRFSESEFGVDVEVHASLSCNRSHSLPAPLFVCHQRRISLFEVSLLRKGTENPKRE